MKGLRRSRLSVKAVEGSETVTYLSCAGEEGGAETAGLLFSSLETFSWSPGFTGRGILGLRLARGVTELTILRDNNNLLLLSTELQDRESPVIPGLGGDRQSHYRPRDPTLTWRLWRILN